MYRRLKPMFVGVNESCVKRLFDSAVLPFDPANTDYAQFKLDITNGSELQDADGAVMTAEQVQDFLATLP